MSQLNNSNYFNKQPKEKKYYKIGKLHHENNELLPKPRLFMKVANDGKTDISNLPYPIPRSNLKKQTKPVPVPRKRTMLKRKNTVQNQQRIAKIEQMLIERSNKSKEILENGNGSGGVEVNEILEKKENDNINNEKIQQAKLHNDHLHSKANTSENKQEFKKKQQQEKEEEKEKLPKKQLTNWIKKKIQKDKAKKETKIFGVPLNVAIEREGRDETSPPSIIEQAIMYLEEKGKFEEGIYRLTGSILQREQLKQQYDNGEQVTLDHIKNQNTVGSLIKLYFRELPEPILGEKYTPRLPKLESRKPEIIKKRLIHVYNNIPEVNKAVLRWLLPHLHRVSLQSKINKMDTQNLALIFSPTLQIPYGLMDFMITNWMDILCDDENEKIQKKNRFERESEK
ncbi:gtpase-activating protein bem3 [Anaeramoeba flamelloides]|uniref:Gtpase-activating protein bem3 n=1 Tax=Anaeramoeba flamelloides TaxID=1746091 RepID=A0AAV7Z238_9EUKA|nr:gtpase-activating protein bem3 [Anaeramoeba flamelloides]